VSSQRQLEANRRNAQFSTGPKTSAGKKRSRKNALKHGLTASTVVDVFESRLDFEAFRRLILTDLAPASFIEEELASRLASLLWRLRRANAVETGIIELHGRIQRERREDAGNRPADAVADVVSVELSGRWAGRVLASNANDAVEVARCFLRVSNFDGGLFERIGRYEKVIWRQAREIIRLLKGIAF